MKKFITLGFIILTIHSLKAQIALPYYTGFDNASQQNGWMEYRTASSIGSSWGYGSSNAFSAPTKVGHDYSPSSGISLMDDWFVSPAFSISAGGTLDSIRYMFSGFSQPVAGDTVGLYLFNGSQDPSLATSKRLLFDFRGTEYIADNTYRLKTNINLPAFSGNSYLAIRYRNTDCSSKWLTISFDNVAISANGTTGLNESKNKDKINVYPNPTSGNFTIDYLENAQSITIRNKIGQTVYRSSNLHSSNSIEVDLSNKPKGIYIITVLKNKKVINKKIILQ